MLDRLRFVNVDPGDSRLGLPVPVAPPAALCHADHAGEPAREGDWGKRMRESTKRSLAIASVAMIAAGTLAIAGSASANSYSGTLTCPSSTYLKAAGYKGLPAYIYVHATNDWERELDSRTGVWLYASGGYSSGSWSAWGGATSAYPYCGT